MPLAFESMTHGKISFGFFNIETDMLILEHYFFFATEFCQALEELALREDGDQSPMVVKAHDIADPAAIGDLMGSIRGTVHTGFIGELYQRFPFPQDPEGFKQQPEGVENQALLLDLINRYGQPATLHLTPESEKNQVSFNEYGFTTAAFQELIDYVWRGGYPRWRDGTRPDYVSVMKESLEKSGHGLIRGMEFSIP